MPMYATWQSRPVFITSTFRDMQAERDCLRARVFPVIEERLRRRYHFLEPIDLRWGVQTISVSEQQAKELLVLKVCLAEIQRSRPFLIALIGDRYGWVPPEERMRTAAAEAGYQTEPRGKSVTALEIEYGILDSPDQRKLSRFYFRDPLPYDAMGADAAVYSDLHSGEPGAADAHFLRAHGRTLSLHGMPQCAPIAEQHELSLQPRFRHITCLRLIPPPRKSATGSS